MESKKKGEIGEQKALEYLRKKGYRLVHRNYRCRFGEIDLIVSRKKKLVFVEVKSGKADFIEPFQRVNKNKLRKIIYAINYYLVNEKVAQKFHSYQLDVVSVHDDGVIKHFEDVLNFEM
ncbi:MAG: putative endonuclease [Thermotogaceae bacterium]|jgi:putative endonuclease|nr:putative endonuclease [Thermotogaceae bacterium]MDN5338482.1 putative endonuclease [Thermotogaceae bacterium]